MPVDFEDDKPAKGQVVFDEDVPTTSATEGLAVGKPGPVVEKAQPRQPQITSEKPKARTSALSDVLNRGVVASNLGAPVDIATMAMRPFGYKEEAPVGGSEWIGNQMERMGFVSDVRRPLLETGASFLTPGVGAATLLGKAASKLSSKATSAAEQAAEKLRQYIPGLGQESIEQIMSRGKRRELNLREAEQKFGSEIQAEREASARSFSDLGTPQTDKAVLGDEMQRRIVGTEFTRGSRLSQSAARDYAEYFKQAAGFEKSTARDEMMKALKAMSESSSAGSPGRKYASEALQDLEMSKDAVGAEKEFKKYFEQASALQKQGFGAEIQQANRTVSEIIGNALNTHAPKRIEARQTYKEIATPLDAYETLFGAKGVAKETKVPDRLKMMPTDYPSTYFKNRDTIRSLKEQLAGDDAAVRKFANQHAVNELAGKDAKAAESWLKDNTAWIDEVPGLSDRVKRYVSKLSKSEAAIAEKETAKQAVGKKAKDVVSTRQAEETKLQQDIKDLALLSPDKVSVKAGQIVSDLESKKLIDPSSAAKVKKQIAEIDRMFEGEAKSKRIRDVLVKAGFLTVTGYSGYELYKAF